jgi:hypothetical protein
MISMLNATTTESPRFSHDCECCAFVGQARHGDHDGDVWFCLAHKELIVRFSDRDANYMARPLSVFGQVSYGPGGDFPLWTVALDAFKAWKAAIAAL